MTLSPPSTPNAPLQTGPSNLRAAATRWIDLLGPTIALLVIFFAFTLMVPGRRFLSFDNFDNILRQACVPGVAALGMTYVIIAGGIDLSLGSMVALATVIIAVILRWPHHYDTSAGGTPIPVTWLSLHPVGWPLFAGLMGILTGLICGVVNGLLVTALRLAPFIVTLGTMMIFRGLAKQFSGGQAITPSDQWLNSIVFPVDGTPHLRWMVFAPGVWLTLLLALVMAFLLNYSRFGRHAIAIGSNENTARLCGIPINTKKLGVYAIGGLFGGFAALFLFSRQSQGSPTLANGFELEVIAAVVIGGASLTGGKGSISGALVGALIMNVIGRGCAQMYIGTFLQRVLGSDSPVGLPSNIQEIVTGVIIIIAVLIDTLRQRRRG
jgi:ribose/xylose/arabinose/galactoside ABC-type transport system permease subunit